MIGDNIYVGRGNASMHDEYLDFINYVFGFNGREQDFPKLLPKLYAREDNPAANSYVVVENGRMKGAVGAFDHSMTVCGRSLRCRSIGNVAAHPYDKSRGFMKSMMNMALEDMVHDGIVLSTLGGRRQRYNYFSYEKSGTTYRFTVGPDNMRHTYGADRSARRRFEVRPVKADDTASLDAIEALLSRQQYVPTRPRVRLHDILRSWKMVPVAFWEGDRFAGYAVLREGSVTEWLMAEENATEIADAVISLFDWRGGQSLTFKLPAFSPAYIEVLYPLAEGYALEINESYSVLNFTAVADAFLALKATYADLPDGKLTLLIHGRAGDEHITLSVQDGKTAVYPAAEEDAVDAELEHLEAINLLFSSFCPAREHLPYHARVWLPLPIWMYAADEV